MNKKYVMLCALLSIVGIVYSDVSLEDQFRKDHPELFEKYAKAQETLENTSEYQKAAAENQKIESLEAALNTVADYYSRRCDYAKNQPGRLALFLNEDCRALDFMKHTHSRLENQKKSFSCKT